MNAQHLIVELQKLDVELWVEDEKLRFSAPPGVMTDVRLQQLKENKQAILDWLGRALRSKDSNVEPIPIVSREETLPASFAQERLWFLDQLESGNEAYVVPWVSRLKGELQVDVLLKCLRLIIARHESLRTRFVESPGGPLQVISDQVDFELKQIDLSGLKENEREPEILSLLQAEKKRPFDLASDVLIRASLLRLAEDEHVLTLMLHHIVSDGWSMGVLTRELIESYSAFSHGEQPFLPDLPVQYADFAAWQRQWLSGAELDKQLHYWRRKLGNLNVLELPTDRVRPAMQTYDGDYETLSVQTQLSDQLENFSGQAGVTLFMTMLAGFILMLHRYSGQHDVVVGSPIANRNRTELEGLIAFFVNMLVLRVDCEGNPDFNTLVKRVSEVALGAYEHQDIPFEKLVEVLQVERDPSRNPLFQVQFALQNASQTSAPKVSVEKPASLSFEAFDGESSVTRFDLECHVWINSSGELQISFAYNTNLFDASTIRRMLRHFANLLGAVVGEPDKPIDELPMLDADERRLLEQWRQAPSDYPREQTVQALFEEQVRSSPAAVAAEYEGESLSYAELNARANQVGHYLQARGVGPEVVVGICIERSLEMLVALLGILKAGGAYLPLDPEYPQSRLDFMLADSAAPVLLTLSSFTPQFDAFTGRTICLDRDWAEISQESTDNPDSGATAESLIYVIYTSGSTGVPKGTLIEQRSAVRLVQNTNFVELGADEVFLQFAPISFDASTFELWGSLLNGARLVIFPAGRSALEELGEVIEARGVTTLWLTSALFSQMVEHHLERLQGVRQLLAGGEALSLPHVRKMIDNLGENRLINGYGPTENTTFTCCHVMTRDSELGQSVPIGRPISNTTVYILDKRMNPVPVGVAGELYIGGDGLARGYLNQAELTAEKFVADPFAEGEGARLYRTGDQVRYRDDGSIEFLGRIDQQIKLRGYRIELGEIETALTQQEAVSEAVSIVREDETGDKRIIAYVVPTLVWREQHADTSDESAADELIPELRERLREQLPSYMVPSLFMVLEALPLNANDKVDRAALPDPDADRAGLEVGYVAPRTELETQLAQIWAEVLKLEQVGIHDNFFDLGGHSLMATQVVSRVRDQLETKLPLVLMLSDPTIAEQAPVIASLLGTGSKEESVVIAIADRSGELPLSFAQERLWFLDKMHPGNPAYIIPMALRLRGELSIDALLASLNTIVARHEALRTRFINQQGGPVQVIDEVLDFELAQIDLSTVAVENHEAEVMACLLKEKTTPFKLSDDPLIRGKLLRLSDVEHVLLLTMHHIVSDAWSLGVMFNELGECYAAFCRGDKPALGDLPIQYADFAVWQRQWLSGEQLAKQMDYWNQQLSELPVLDLPTDRIRPAVQTYDGALEFLSLDSQLSARLEQFTKDSGVTLFMTLLSAYLVMLRRYSGQDDIAVGTPIANRNRSEVEGLIAVFVNMLVMRVDCSGNPDFNSLLKRVSEVALGAYEHQDIPFEKLVEVLQADRDTSRNPLFQVHFALQNAPLEALQLEGLGLEPIGSDIEATRFDLECHVSSSAGQLHIGFIYNTNLFERATVQQMQRHFVNLLSAAVAAPDQPIDLLPMLDADESQLLLEQWNQSRTDYASVATLDGLYAAEAARHPDATAIEYDGATLSYAELDARSNQLAHYLRARGVGPEVMVGLYMERGLDLIVGLLGILKAGGAYVPLDPEYPAERLEFILADCAAPLLLTQTALQGDLPAYPGQVVYLDTDWPAIEQEETSALPVAVQAENAAYVIYTSGSTGQPKGVVVTHANVSRLFAATEDWYGFNEDDVWTLFHSSAFDFSVWEIWGALLHGGRLVVVPFTMSRSAELFYDLLVESGVTVLNQTPSAFKQLVAADEGRDPGSLAALRLVIFGGEALNPQSLAPWFARHGDQQPQLVNMYGITETTVHVTYRPLSAEVVERGASVIGRTIPDLQVYILDSHLQPVPVGVAGEMYVGGAGLARGYLNRAELTAERFIDHPFSQEEGARLYRTGDLARYLADGDIEYLGRNDQQVKLRGFRIELGEIESWLVQHARVREAVVVCREDALQGQRLVAYVRSDGGVEPTLLELREHARQKLPEYMVPSIFMVLECFPLTANGKLDLRALPEPESERQTGEVFVEPRSDLERQLAEVWCKVLTLERVGIHDNFFDLGGHSLMVVQVVGYVRDELGVTIDVVDLFSYPTVSTLAESILQLDSSEAQSRDAPAKDDNLAARKERMQQLRHNRQRNQNKKDLEGE